MKNKLLNKFIYKLFSLAICFVMICPNLMISAAETSSAEAEQSEEYQAAVELLINLNILDADIEYEEIAEVSRESMALYAAKLMGVEKTESDKRYYVDVPSASYGAGAIEYLTDIGVFTQPEDKRFYPENIATSDELTKVLTSILGYDRYAKSSGGYPVGYRLAARKADLYEIPAGNVTFKNLVLSLKSALEANMYEAVSYGTDGGVEMANTDENILSKYHKTYTSDGSIDSIGGISVNDSTIEDGEISVNGSVYKLGCDIYKPDLLGKYVKFYYSENSNIKTVKLIVPYNKEKVISIDDVTKMNQSELIYRENDKTVTKTLGGYTYVYNGEKLKSKVDETLKNLNKGTVVLCDMNDDGSDDTVVVWDFRNFVISGVGSDQMIVSNKLKGGGNIKYEDYDEVLIYNDQKVESEWSDLLAGQVLSVASSVNKEALYLIITDKTFNGTIDSMSSDNSEDIVISGEKYKIENSYMAEFYENAFSPGEVYTFKADAFGKIAYAEAFTTEGSMTFAYVIDAAKTNNAFGDYNIQLKLILQDNTIATLELADKVKIDAAVCKTGKEKTSAFGSNAVPEKAIVDKLIRISKDSDGKINKIDTAKVAAGESAQSSMSVIGDENFSTKWYNAKRLGLMAYVDPSKTYVFCVPQKSFNSGDELEYKTSTMQDMFIEDARPDANIYTVSDKSEYAEAIVYRYKYSELKKNENFNQIDLIMVDSVGRAIDNDGTPVNCIIGMKNGSAVTINIPNDVDISNVGNGDIIRLRYGINDQIIPSYESGKPDIIVCYDYSEYQGQSPAAVGDWNIVSEPSGGSYVLYEKGSSAFHDYRLQAQLSFGYAAKKNSSLIWWDGMEKGRATEVYNVSSLPIIIYDSNKQNGSKLYKGTIADIDDYESVGDACSRVLLYTGGPYGRAMFVYK